MTRSLRLREEWRGLYTRVFGKLADSVQMIDVAAAQGIAAVGFVTIPEKMDLFWALRRGGVEIRWEPRDSQSPSCLGFSGEPGPFHRCHPGHGVAAA